VITSPVTTESFRLTSDIEFPLNADI